MLSFLSVTLGTVPFGLGSTFPCLLTHCSKAIAGCALDRSCRQQLACSTKCFNAPDVGSCAALCLNSYPSASGTALNKCMNQHECVPLPFSMNDTCKEVNDAVPFNMSLLAQNEWWVIFGKNPTADCHDCQRRHIHPSQQNVSKWTYDYTTLVPAANGSYFNYTLHTPLAPTLEQLTRMESWRWPWGEDNGLPFIEHWYLLDHADSHLQIYYCLTFDQTAVPTRSPDLMLEGGLILSRAKSIPDSRLTRISAIYAKMGVDFSSYCKVNNTCTDE